MFLTVAGFKGGVGKTTTAVHLASGLQMHAPTLLVDGDANRSALAWNARRGLPMRVVDERAAARYAREYDHIVVDTEARPNDADLKALSEGCDLLIIPSTPDALALDALLLTVEALQRIGVVNYRILLTMVPPRPSRDGEEARSMLLEGGLPLFHSYIPRLAAFTKAALAGVPVYQVDDPRAIVGWEAYLRVAEELGV